MDQKLHIELLGKLKILRFSLYLLGGFLILSLIFAIAAFFSLSWIHEGHIWANVPEQDQFSITLTRDLNRYFSDKLASQVDVKYQLLGDQPTQAGLAFPKFYAWVTVLSLPSGTKIEEGAVKLAARDKVSFSVTDFVSVDDIKTHHDDLKKIFPTGVLEKIQNRPD
jgi:hypothetical protein